MDNPFIMVYKHIRYTFGAFFFAITSFAATPVIEYEQIQVTHCLAAKLSSAYPIRSHNTRFKILDVPSTDLDAIQRIAHASHCGGFINVTQKLAHQSARQWLHASVKPRVADPAIVYPLEHADSVYAALSRVEPNAIWETVTHLSTYTNRGAKQQSGVDTANWLKAQFERMAMESGRTDTTTYFVSTGGRYIQPSLVTVIGADIKAPAVVLGAHMDTLGQSAQERMPGAGDDASGSASLMEMARVLLASNLPLKRPVYFIWYAAEEAGLVGSQRVVDDFIHHAIPVYAAIQFDMTGYRQVKDDPTMWVFRDYTDKALSDFTAALIHTYINVPVKESTCGYGCSDHAAWYFEGIPTAFPCETSFEAHNPYIHTAGDTIDLLSVEHMANFTKLGLAFAIELAL